MWGQKSIEECGEISVQQFSRTMVKVSQEGYSRSTGTYENNLITKKEFGIDLNKID